MIIRATLGVLALLAVVWSFGAIVGGWQLWTTAVESAAARSTYGIVPWQSLVLGLSAVGARWAVAKRQAIGRWVGIGLGCVALYRHSIGSIAYAWRASQGDFAAPRGMFSYSSVAEARFQLAFSVAIGV